MWVSWLQSALAWPIRWWLGAVRHRVLIWTNDDQAIWCHMTTSHHNGLTQWSLVMTDNISIHAITLFLNILYSHEFPQLIEAEWRIYYRNQCWNIVNWTTRNKIQWNFNRNIYIFDQENPFENVVWKMSVILSRPQCVNKSCVLILELPCIFCPIKIKCGKWWYRRSTTTLKYF